MQKRSHPHSVRHLAASEGTPLVAAGEFSKNVTIWDLNTCQRKSSFESVLDFGGERLVLSHDGSRCVAAAYQRLGLVCYATDTGDPLWERRDLKKAQYVSLGSDRESVYVGFDSRPCHILNLGTGDTVGTLRGVREVWHDPASRRQLHYSRTKPLNVVEEQSTVALGELCSVLSACFAAEAVVVSEVGGPVRCFNGKLRRLWNYVPPEGAHVLDLVFCPSACAVFGVQWPYHKGGPHKLLRFAPQDGTVREVAGITEAWETCFCCEGTRLLASGGQLIDTQSGDQVANLPLPV